MNTINYFGYGLLRERQIVKEIIGRDPGAGRPAIIKDYQLAYQVLTQLPEQIRPRMQKAWGDTFKAYTLRKGSGVVAGVIWELSEEELGKIKVWEIVGTWRETVTGTVITSDGEHVPIILTKVSDIQPINETVNGIQYETYLNRKNVVSDELKEQDRELLSSVRLQLQELAAQGAYGKQAFT